MAWLAGEQGTARPTLVYLRPSVCVCLHGRACVSLLVGHQLLNYVAVSSVPGGCVLTAHSPR